MNKKILTIFLAIFVIIFVFLNVYLSLLNKKTNNGIQIEKDRLTQQKKEECVGMSVKKYDYEVELDEESSLFNIVHIEPKYNYNKNLDTCLYFGGYDGDFSYRRYVIDLYTNQTLFFTQYNDDINVDGLSIEDFNKKSRELMVEN